MKFFVMLAVLLLRSLPGQALTLPLDRLYARWQLGLARYLKKAPGSIPVFLASLLPWILLLWLLLWLLEDWLWSLPTLAVHLLVVFYALGRRSELLWIDRYMVAWRQGDHQAASYYAEEILEEPGVDQEPCRLHARLISRLIYFAFDRLFLVLFWYLLLGPVGALLVRLSEQALKTAQRHNPETAPACDEQVELFHRVLEWPAARLMGLTLALLSHPWRGLKQFSRDLLSWKLSSEAFLERQLVAGYGQVASQRCLDIREQRPELMSEEADRELSLMNEWIWRSLAIWVAASALGVIFWS
ncbi:regulatory signaling modulator protein AmpE [Marinospirillum perlucidum]|uniref:regulatory signaling modulator protein AmpE n=1 Tax=Marinospirillum perlucidum TaxID=1982602 RepID=UPI000DF4A249|nr:regulatory signaling modulator protein AmpE [Marinospirillum perlucidum]